MTLDFSRTASRCAVVRALYPMINEHFDLRWQRLTRRETDYAPMWQKPSAVFQNLIFDLRHFLPEGKYWDRTRLRVGSTQQSYLIRRDLFDYAEALERGDTCLCGTTCRYPTDPAS